MRVLIFSTSIGTGHVRAAQAIEKAFKAFVADVVVRHEDSLSFANAAFRKVYQQTYIDLVAHAPDLLGIAYDYADRSWEKLHYGMALERMNIQKLAKLVKDFRPDIVISTHSLPADMISWLLCRKEISCHHAVVITDFDLHSVWLCHHYSRYFVALDETREHMIKLGFESSRIIVSGIPIDQVFSVAKEKRQMRIKHKLDPDKVTILVSAGGLGMGPVDEILDQLVDLDSSHQLVIVCGANSDLYERIKSRGGEVRLSGPVIFPLKYTAEMDEYMAASDLIIGKPGGLTSAEALARGLVFVIVKPIPGQEERNSDHLLEEGCAIRCNNLPTLSYKVQRLVEDKKQLASRSDRALLLARPLAARTIVDDLSSMFRAGENPAAHPPGHTCEHVWSLNSG